MKKGERPPGKTASELIDERIRELEGWRGATLARMRKLILEADPEITEEWKWSVPVWSHDGIIHSRRAGALTRPPADARTRRVCICSQSHDDSRRFF